MKTLSRIFIVATIGIALIIGLTPTQTAVAATTDAKLTPDDGVSGDRFGYAVSISGDTALIGAYQDDDIGSAYVYVRSDNTWTQQQKLTPDDGASGDRFGYSLSISGNYVVISAPWADDNGSGSGSAYNAQLLPVIHSVDPDLVDQGNALDAVIGGAYFDGASEISFGTGVTVNSFTVNSPSQITANITVADDAMLGYRDVSVTAARGSNILRRGLFVQQALPNITWFNPETINQGETVDVTITGIYFAGASEVDLGTGITINSFSVDSSYQITANITVAPDAWVGARDISVTTPRGSDTMVRGFDLVRASPTGGGCGCCTSAVTIDEIVSGWGLIGFLGFLAVCIRLRQKKGDCK